jgi:DNA-damage-inducible protein J
MSRATADTYVRARIDSDTKKRAMEALDEMGMTLSEAIRMLMERIAEERCFPFAVNVPDAVTTETLLELELGRSGRLPEEEDLMAYRHADD